MLTPDDINEIRRRCEAATKGPWEIEHKFDYPRGRDDPGWYEVQGELPAGLNPNCGPYSLFDSMNRHHCVSPDEDRANMELTKHSRTDIPLLLSALAEREAEVWRLRDEVRLRIGAYDLAVGRSANHLLEIERLQRLCLQAADNIERNTRDIDADDHLIQSLRAAAQAPMAQAVSNPIMQSAVQRGE